MHNNNRRKGFFAVVEGVDGSGKSSAAHGLHRELKSLGIPCILTREPGGTQAGEELRGLLLARRNGDWDWDPMSELLLMTAARVEHVKHVIKPHIDKGFVVICDRFIGSTIAFQGAGRGIPLDFITSLHNQAVGGLYPDLTLTFDVDVNIGLARSGRKLIAENLDEGRFEAVEESFHQRVRRSYLDQAAAAHERFAVIDATPAPDIVMAAAIKALMAHFSKHI